MLMAQLNRLFETSRRSAGSRMIQGLLSDEGVAIRFKIRRLMNELRLICKQSGPHAYKKATVERLNSPESPATRV
jgi:putative transposase